jgi:hypothetical protein
MANNKMKSTKNKISQIAKFQFCAISPLRNEVRKNIAKNTMKNSVGQVTNQIINQPITSRILSHVIVPKIKIISTSNAHHRPSSQSFNLTRPIKSAAKIIVKKFVGHSTNQIINQPITSLILSHALVPETQKITTSNAHHRLSSQSFHPTCPIKSTAKITVKKLVGHANHQIISQPITGRFLSHALVPIIKKSTTSKSNHRPSSQSFHLTRPIKSAAKIIVKKFVGQANHQIINQPITGRFLSHAPVPKIKKITTSNAHHRPSSQSSQPVCPIKSEAKIIVKKFVGQATHQIINQSITSRFLSHALVPKIKIITTSNAHQSQSSQSFNPSCPIKSTAKIIVKKFVGHSTNQIINQPIADKKLSHVKCSPQKTVMLLLFSKLMV